MSHKRRRLLLTLISECRFDRAVYRCEIREIVGLLLLQVHAIASRDTFERRSTMTATGQID
jgi:hypothetical protein